MPGRKEEAKKMEFPEVGITPGENKFSEQCDARRDRMNMIIFAIHRSLFSLLNRDSKRNNIHISNIYVF